MKKYFEKQLEDRLNLKTDCFCIIDNFAGTKREMVHFLSSESEFKKLEQMCNFCYFPKESVIPVFKMKESGRIKDLFYVVTALDPRVVKEFLSTTINQLQSSCMETA